MPPDVAQRITRSLDRLKAEDLMVGPEMMQRPFLEVGYMDVGQNSDVTLCMFLLKKGASIPLHDHPQMHARAPRVQHHAQQMPRLLCVFLYPTLP
eukprot:g10716.t1